MYMKVALVYDRVNSWGGAERVLLALNKIFPEAPLYTSAYNERTAPWSKVFPSVIPSFLQNIPLAKSRHDLFPYLMPLAFESFDFSSYDLVISVTSEAAKGIITKPGTKHICYCLTPTRYLWSGYEEYFKNSTRRHLVDPIVRYLRAWDKQAAQRPDVMVGISKEVVGRIKKYYGRDAKLIYPPVEYSALRSTEKSQDGPYYLVVSRLVPYKKVDLVVQLFNQMNRQLVVVGSGSDNKKLRNMAGPNIKFAGHITDAELWKYYAGCKALIFPQKEDFGITAVEAQLAGKPVIAYKKGGASETVINGKTGILFDEQTTGSLANAIQRLERMKFNPIDCVENAKRFSFERFKEKFAKLTSARD